jgi:DNA repair ATPase RecN
MLYRSTNCRCRRGAPVMNLPHSASFHSCEKIAPSNDGIKQLGKAHVLPDGRRVFETEDGLRVFDEHGRELDASTISPEEIEDSRPRWETAKQAIDRLDALTQEREHLLVYQEKLDHARERLDAGDLTREEFDNLRDELKDDMPESVREQLSELEQEQETAAEPDATPAEELKISDDMVPATSKPSGLAFDR